MSYKTKWLAVVSSAAALSLGLWLVPSALASSSSTTATYGVTVNGFANDRLYNSNTSHNASTVAPASEPQIRADLNGNLYISSEYGLGGGTGFWRSMDGGQSYSYEGVANALINGSPAQAGGGDTDIAVAPAKNVSGSYNVYMSSLSLANVDVSTSTDGGKTFTTNYVSGDVPVDDREWLAASGSSTVYLSYHDVATDNIDIERSDNAGQSWTIVGEAINPLSNNNVVNASNDNELGNIAATPDGRYLYQTFVAGVGPEENTQGYPMRGVYMAVSTDGGQTFTDYNVNIGPEGTQYGHQFPQVCVDKAGNVYALYTDNTNLYMSVSTDHGQTWSGPYQVNRTGPAPNTSDPFETKSAWIADPNTSVQTASQPAPYSANSTPGSFYSQELIPAYSNVSIEPWAVAGDPGKIDIVWYGTNMTQGADGQSATDSTDDHVHWTVFMAQSLNALSGQPTFQVAPISPVVHRAGVCEAGVSCTSSGEDNRDLYDDFGVTYNPLTGLAAVTYSSDQLDPSDSTYISNENSASHTGYAVQTSTKYFAPIVSTTTSSSTAVTSASRTTK